MNRLQLIKALQELDRLGRYVFTVDDIRRLFYKEGDSTFHSSLSRHIHDGILIRACRGILVNPNAKSFDSFTVERIAATLRRGEYNYVSLESSLSEYGDISQIPLDLITVMTTGRSQRFKTPYGNIEFTHTKKPSHQIIEDIISVPGRPLRIAKREVALRDLKRVGRNLHLLGE